MKFRNLISQFLLIAILIAADQITKAIFTSRDFFVGFMHLHLVKNPGLSFGLDFGKFNLLIILIATVLFLVYLSKQRSSAGAIFVVAGAAANILDRLRLGYVRDFWDVGLNFTFNLADLFVLIGLVLILLRSENSNQEQSVE
jgi:signal peptidase II